MTPEKYAVWAQLEGTLKEQAKVTPIDVDSLRGCLMMAIQMAAALELSLKDLQALCSDEHSNWVDYVEVKRKLIEKRKAIKR